MRTETYKDIENDLADILDVDNLYLFERLCTIYDEERNANDYVDNLTKKINQFISENLNPDFILDEIYVYHLARLISVPKELKPLKQVATTDNEFSRFLKSNDIEIVEKEGKLELYYKNRWMPAEMFREAGQSLLAVRFGHLGEADFCVNGFPFWPDIEKTSHHYYNALKKGPEIIENLGRFLKINLVAQYQKQSKYYGVVLKAPIENIFFDGLDRITGKKEKTRLIIDNALRTLMSHYNDAPSGDNNPIIRFSDNESIPVDYVIEIQ